MRLRVLGKSPSWQDAAGACSGYLLQDGPHSLLLDCGNGVFGKLRALMGYADVRAVVISHLHADHFLDLVPYAYALTYGAGAPARIALHAPAGARDVFRRVVGAWGSEDLIEAAFDLREYEPDDVLEVGSMQVRFAPVPHYVPTHAVEVRSAAGARITYGADHRPCEALVRFARDTELLLIEATLAAPESDGPRGHLTPREAGDHARRAGARRVLLTHISDEQDESTALREASDAYGAPVGVAREGVDYDL